MSNILMDLASGLAKIVKDKVKLRSLNKSDIQTLLRNNIEGHKKMVYVLDLQDDRSWQSWFNKDVKNALNKSNSPAKGVLNNYIKALSGKAAQEERKRPLKSLREANDKFAEVLENISKKIDMLMEQEAIDIYNVRMSHIAVLGILRQSDMVMNFSMYLYAFLVRSASHTVSSIPRYREIFLQDKQDRVSKIVSQILDKKGPYTFLGEVQSLRSKQADIVLGATGFSTPGNSIISGFSISFLDNIMTALSCLNIFGAALDAWDDYKMEKYEKNKETKEWLEQHNALLRMDLEEMDKTSPQYQKTLAVIKAYDEKIAEYDEKITKFEQED